MRQELMTYWTIGTVVEDNKPVHSVLDATIQEKERRLVAAL